MIFKTNEHKACKALADDRARMRIFSGAGGPEPSGPDGISLRWSPGIDR